MQKKFCSFFFMLFPFICQATYPSYKEVEVMEDQLKYFPESCGYGAYLDSRVTQFIDKNEISSILEVGSRDARDAIKLSQYYKSHVFAFECNPECQLICKCNVALTPNVTLVEKAVWDKSGVIDFYPIIPDQGKIRDPGSSSCFLLTEEKKTQYSQAKISVQAIRLDEWMQDNNFENIDLICMDTQGATLKILQSMGDYLKNTKYIVTECEVQCTYKEECLLPELVSFLNLNGFELVPALMEWDYLFVNKSYKKK